MLQRFSSTCLELFVLAISTVFIYLEELIRLVLPRRGKSLKGEIILVTGAASGLGKEICKQLVKSQAKLVLWDVAEEGNKKAAQELRDLGAEFVIADTVDVADRNQIAIAAARLRAQVGDVTILVNNAGVCFMQQFMEQTPEAVETTFKVNVISHFWTIREFLPHMLQINRGHIVTVCSTMGQMAIRGPAPYYSTKHAVHGFIECLKDELAHLPHKCDIKFTTAYPFFFKSGMVTGDNIGLHLKFKFPSITPFMEISHVAKRIVQGIQNENEYLYIPETFRIYLASKFFLPSKLHRLFVDFFVNEWHYSSKHVNGSSSGGYQTIGVKSKKSAVEPNSFTNLLNFTNGFSSASLNNLSTQKEK